MLLLVRPPEERTEEKSWYPTLLARNQGKRVKSKLVKLSVDFVEFSPGSLVLLRDLVHFLLQCITFAFQRRHFALEMFRLDIDLTESNSRISYKIGR